MHQGKVAAGEPLDVPQQFGFTAALVKHPLAQPGRLAPRQPRPGPLEESLPQIPPSQAGGLKGSRAGSLGLYTAVIDFEYSIEPMVKEPSPGFYKTFLLVKEGDHVKKGDVIAYMYLPKGSEGAHIHFELINSATHAFMAPAIFSKETVAEFYGTWKNFGFDSNDGPKNPIPPCIGWKLTADENPLENKAVDCLTYPAASGA